MSTFITLFLHSSVNFFDLSVRPFLDLKFPFQPKKNNHGLTHVHTFAFGLHNPRNILWASQRTLEVEL